MESHILQERHFSLSVSDQSGNGTTEVFQVFPGIFLMYNDFHLLKCRGSFVPPENFWGIEHCRSGKTEWELEGGDFAYLGSGALMPCDYQESQGEFSFPGKLFEGLALGFAMPLAESSLPPQLEMDLSALRRKIMSGGILDISGDPQAEIVLRLLYLSRFQSDFHRQLACLEFLLYLRDLEPVRLIPLYLRRKNVEEIKEIESFLAEHLEKRWTLSQLSERFRLPVSMLRRNFTAIYGVSVADHMKRLRIDRAKHMLLEGSSNVSQIAASLGYDNASKFSAAFRLYTDLTPTEYRRRNK